MRIYKGLSVLVGVAALSLTVVAPASAEFFSCRDKPGQLLYSYNGTPDSYRSHNPHSRASAYRSYGSSEYSAHTRYYRAGSSHATDYRSQRYGNDR
jgi:DNA topoisomerase IB